MTADVQIFTVTENPDCIACAFSVEAMAEALERNLFPLCAAHLLRFNVVIGDDEPHLHAILPDVLE